MYSPLASAEAVLSREDAENGAVVIDIGNHLTHLGASFAVPCSTAR